MGWCEQNRVDFLFGLARNKRLQKTIGRQMQEAKRPFTPKAPAASLPLPLLRLLPGETNQFPGGFISH